MGISRRELLAGMSSVAAVGAGSGLERDSDNDGLSYQEGRQLEAVIAEEYGEREVPDLDSDGKDLIVDARYVEGEEFAEEYKEEFERLFASHDIRLHWLDHPERFDREEFRQQYGHDTEDILGCDGLYGEVTRSELRDNAVQLFFVPGKPADPYEGSVFNNDGGSFYFSGYSAGNRAVIGSSLEGWRRAVTVLHEIGHLELDHQYDNEANRGVMGQKEVLDFEEYEWGRLRDNLSNVGAWRC